MNQDQHKHYVNYIVDAVGHDIPDDPYHNLMYRVLTEGSLKTDRTGTGTLSLFGESLTYDVIESYVNKDGDNTTDYMLPTFYTKPVHYKSVLGELLWFLSGDTNIKSLHENGVTIWDEWADENGDLGPVYGSQWREFGGEDGVDQIDRLMKGLINDPLSRRHIVSAWNPNDLDKMALPPCHMMFQLNCEQADDNEYLVSLQMYQRSADLFLGVPFNIQSYSTLLAMICATASGVSKYKFTPDTVKIVFGDVHVYLSHLAQAEASLMRQQHIEKNYDIFADSLMVSIKPKEELTAYDINDFSIETPLTMPKLPAPVSV